MIIGISGNMGSGKSTAIEALKTLGKPVCIVKFAAPIYKIQEAIYHIIAPVYTRPEGFVKDRKLLQWIGTDWARDTLSKTLWVDLFKFRVAQVQARDSDVIIVSDDTRFDNEAETIKSLGGIVIRLEREDSATHAEGGTGIANHASEAGIKPELVDYRIKNEGTLEEFQESFRQLILRIEAEQAA